MISNTSRYHPQLEKSFLNLVDLNQIWIVIILFRLIEHQTELSLVPNQSKKGITVQIWFNLTRFKFTVQINFCVSTFFLSN